MLLHSQRQLHVSTASESPQPLSARNIGSQVDPFERQWLASRQTRGTPGPPQAGRRGWTDRADQAAVDDEGVAAEFLQKHFLAADHRAISLAIQRSGSTRRTAVHPG